MAAFFLRSFYVTQASIEGISPLEYYQKHPYRIVMEGDRIPVRPPVTTENRVIKTDEAYYPETDEARYVFSEFLGDLETGETKTVTESEDGDLIARGSSYMRWFRDVSKKHGGLSAKEAGQIISKYLDGNKPLTDRQSKVFADIISAAQKDPRGQQYAKEMAAFEELEDYFSGKSKTFNQAAITIANEALRRDAEAWGKEIDKVKQAGVAPSQNIAMLNQTPLVLRLIGKDKQTGKVAADGGLSASPHTFQNALDGVHGVTLDMLKQVPEAMADPIAIFDSASQKTKGDVVFMLELKDKDGKTVVVPVALQGRGKNNIEINVVKSAYGKGENKPNHRWFLNQVKTNARYINGQKFGRWQEDSGVQFSSGYANSHGNTIRTDADLVKLKSENPTLYQSAKNKQLFVDAARGIIEKGEYDYYALRRIGEPGEALDLSREWDDGYPVTETFFVSEEDVGDYRDSHRYDVAEDPNEYGEYLVNDLESFVYLDGTSGLEVNSANVEEILKDMHVYGGEQIVLMASDYGNGGNDPGEIVLRNPDVLYRSKPMGKWDSPDPNIFYQASTESEATRNIPSNPWPENFPNVTQFTTVTKMRSHADYEAAKSGDMAAADRLVMDIMSGKTQQGKLRALVEKHPDAILVAVHAEERSGKNQIPSKLADYIGYITGLEVDTGIAQIDQVGRTGAGDWYRMAFRPRFDGEVQAGRKYVLVDDVVTAGGTFSELRRYIELNGGEVVDMVSAGTGRYGANITLSEKTKLDLESKFDVESLQQFLREEGIHGGNHEALTEREARTILAAKTLDTARDRITTAKQEGEPSRQPGVLSQARLETPGDPSGQLDPSLSQFSQSNNPPRGGFDPNTLTTILYKEADFSTFVHETSHFFLDTYARMASDPNASQAIKDDMNTILDWFGIDSLETWNNMTMEEKIPYHEQFAYNYELNVFEGKAPSPEMKTVFQHFTKWLKKCYEGISTRINDIYKENHGKDLPILTGEVKQVMDRMIASDEIISHEEAVRRVKPLFGNAEESGMTPEVWEDYNRKIEEAKQEAYTFSATSLSRLMFLPAPCGP